MTDTKDARTDEVLLRAVAQQDIAALAELYRRYAGRSLTLARRHGLPDPVQAVEDAFAILFRSAHAFNRSALPANLWTLCLIQRHCRTLSCDMTDTAPGDSSFAESGTQAPGTAETRSSHN